MRPNGNPSAKYRLPPVQFCPGLHVSSQSLARTDRVRWSAQTARRRFLIVPGMELSIESAMRGTAGATVRPSRTHALSGPHRRPDGFSGIRCRGDLNTDRLTIDDPSPVTWWRGIPCPELFHPPLPRTVRTADWLLDRPRLAARWPGISIAAGAIPHRRTRRRTFAVNDSGACEDASGLWLGRRTVGSTFARVSSAPWRTSFRSPKHGVHPGVPGLPTADDPAWR